MNEMDIVLNDLVEKLATAEANASLWKGRAIAAGWGQEPEESESSDESAS